MIKGTRPGIPAGISSKMMELWNIAQTCWSSHPRDRPSLPMVLGKLNTFASLEAVTPFVLREPKSMQMIGGYPISFCRSSTEISIHKGKEPKLRQNGRHRQPKTTLKQRHWPPSHRPHHKILLSSPYVASYVSMVLLTRIFLVATPSCR